MGTPKPAGEEKYAILTKPVTPAPTEGNSQKASKKTKKKGISKKNEKKSSKESGALNENDEVIKKSGNEKSSSEKTENDKGSKNTSGKEKENGEAQQDLGKSKVGGKSKKSEPHPTQSPDWKGFTALTSPLLASEGENNKTTEQVGGENNKNHNNKTSEKEVGAKVDKAGPSSETDGGKP